MKMPDDSKVAALGVRPTVRASGTLRGYKEDGGAAAESNREPGGRNSHHVTGLYGKLFLQGMFNIM